MVTPDKILERIIRNGLLTTQGSTEPETMQVEDLAALEILTEDSILNELQTKMAKGTFMSFIGDVLLILNPNITEDIYNESVSTILKSCRKYVKYFLLVYIVFFSTTKSMNANQDLITNLTYLRWQIVHIRMLFTIMNPSTLYSLVKVNRGKLLV